jgi:hypothetical protein
MLQASYPSFPFLVGTEINAMPVLFIGVHKTFFCEVAVY